MLRFNCCGVVFGSSKPIISIHPMLRFNRYNNRSYSRSRKISIHPMLRFNPVWTIRLSKNIQRSQEAKIAVSKIISIHPMLRFNEVLEKMFLRLILISIHPMLRFNRCSKTESNFNFHFNTSYVKVQLFSRIQHSSYLCLFQYILC